VDTLWLSEGRGWDSVILLVQLIERLDDVGSGSAIFNVFSRSPTQIAMAISGLDSISDGRFHLGMGVSGPARIEEFHGMP
jgi:alkanesulfonate monooxygenase SsuD/methylene tetrahydromethanopterin reductase-like flavin-dependent oxidoreductase (luciferase family)